MDRITLELSFSIDILDYLFEQCHKESLTAEQYLVNLLYKERRYEEEGKGS